MPGLLWYTWAMNPRRELDADELERLYVNECLTIEEIAARLECGATTIRRRLGELGIATRPRGPHPDPSSHASRREWSPAVAYAVGLIVTDGNLSKDGRHLTFTSADRDLIETFCACLGLDNQVAQTGLLQRHYRVQWSDRVFYDWLLSIGLMPAKSLRLGALEIPDTYFADFVRGCLDGDGNIQVFTDRYNTYKGKRYIYERLHVRFTSASLAFLEWLHANITRLVELRGSIISTGQRAGHSPCWNLQFAQHDSIHLFKWIYYAPDIPCLARKRNQAFSFLAKIE